MNTIPPRERERERGKGLAEVVVVVVAVRDDGSQIAFCPLRPGKAEERPGRPPADHSAVRSEWQVASGKGTKRNQARENQNGQRAGCR